MKGHIFATYNYMGFTPYITKSTKDKLKYKKITQYQGSCENNFFIWKLLIFINLFIPLYIDISSMGYLIINIHKVSNQVSHTNFFTQDYIHKDLILTISKSKY